MLKILKKEGFASFVEITIAAIIFIVAGIGIFTTITMFRPQGNDASNKLKAAYLGQYVLDEMRLAVNADLWNVTDPTLNPLSPGTHNIVIEGQTVVWEVIDNSDLQIRQVKMNVYFNSGL